MQTSGCRNSPLAWTYSPQSSLHPGGHSRALAGDLRQLSPQEAVRRAVLRRGWPPTPLSRQLARPQQYRQLFGGTEGTELCHPLPHGAGELPQEAAGQESMRI